MTSDDSDIAEAPSDNILELLGALPIFAGLTQAQLSAVASGSRKAYFQPGEMVIEAGRRGDTAYLLLSGVGEGGRELLGPGVLVGELAMLAECEYGLDVIARERIRALAIERDHLRQVMEADSGIAQSLADALLVRLSSLADELRRVDAQFAALEATIEQVTAVAS